MILQDLHHQKSYFYIYNRIKMFDSYENDTNIATYFNAIGKWNGRRGRGSKILEKFE